MDSQLYHQRAVQRKRLEWLTRGVVAADATNLELHCVARVDGEHKHPLGATVTEGDTHESLLMNRLGRFAMNESS